eukprot:3725304-Rhodomonas_salina.1
MVEYAYWSANGPAVWKSRYCAYSWIYSRSTKLVLAPGKKNVACNLNLKAARRARSSLAGLTSGHRSRRRRVTGTGPTGARAGNFFSVHWQPEDRAVEWQGRKVSEAQLLLYMDCPRHVSVALLGEA